MLIKWRLLQQELLGMKLSSFKEELARCYYHETARWIEKQTSAHASTPNSTLFTGVSIKDFDLARPLNYLTTIRQIIHWVAQIYAFSETIVASIY